MNHPAHKATQPGTTPTLATSTEAVAIELYQLAHNALASAAWHVARGEITQAMSRIRRAQAHLAHSMSGA